MYGWGALWAGASVPAGNEMTHMVVTAPKSLICPVGFGGGPTASSWSGMSWMPKCVSPRSSAWIMGNFITIILLGYGGLAP